MFIWTLFATRNCYVLKFEFFFPFPLALLFPYGFSNGDSNLPRADDRSYVVFTSTTGIPFLTNRQTRLYVSASTYLDILKNVFLVGMYTLCSRFRIYIPIYFNTCQYSPAIATEFLKASK